MRKSLPLLSLALLLCAGPRMRSRSMNQIGEPVVLTSRSVK